MRPWMLLALATACRLDLDTPEEGGSCVMLTAQTCLDATSHQDFHWINDNILDRNCTGSSCHQATTSDSKAGRQVFDGVADDGTPDYDRSYASLVTGDKGQVFSDIVGNNDVPLVEPAHPEKSYLFFLMRGVSMSDFSPHVGSPPDTIGYMPKGNATLCCQKIDAIDRWITHGAMND